MTFTDIYKEYESKKTTFWLKVNDEQISYVPKGSAQAEVRQASAVGYGVWCRFGFGPYGCLTITKAIRKIAEKEIGAQLALSRSEFNWMKQQAFALKDVAEVVTLMHRFHKIQEIDKQQQALIQKVERRFYSHCGFIRSSCLLFSWNVVKFTMSIPSYFMGLFNHQVRERNNAKKSDLNQPFMHFVSIYKNSAQIWHGYNTAQEKVSIDLLTLPTVQTILIKKGDQRVLQANFWVDHQILQFQLTHHYLEDEEATALNTRLFQKIIALKNLTLKNPLPSTKHDLSYTNIRVTNIEYDNELHCLNTILEGAHKISKLSHLISITTLIEAAQSLNAEK